MTDELKAVDEKVRARQRVAIAKDALAWEKAGALQIGQNKYLVSAKTGDMFHIPMEDQDKQARDLVLGKCQVCALGGLLVAKAVRYNAVTGYDIACASTKRLMDHFDAGQINQIEAAFEGRSYSGLNGTRQDYSWVDSEIYNESWKNKYPDASKRFRAIMKNIIRNKGLFCPDQV